MNENGIEYGRVLADLRARRDKLNAAIAAIEEVSGIEPEDALGDPGQSAPTDASDAPRSPRHHGQVASDAFFQMGAGDAARKYLNMVKRPALNKEIADALKAGGYLTNAKNFYSNLYTTLLRTPGFVKVKKAWGLAEWYRTSPGTPPGRERG